MKSHHGFQLGEQWEAAVEDASTVEVVGMAAAGMPQ